MEFSECDRDLLLEMHICRVYLLIRGRNAWHTTWVHHFLKDAEMYSDLKSAMAGAEQKRERGNKFYIETVPALVLIGTKSKFVIVDPNSSESFKNFLGVKYEIRQSSCGDFAVGIYPSISMLETMEVIRDFRYSWGAKASDDILIFIGDLESIFENKDTQNSYLRYESKAIGSQYYLSWVDEPTSQETTWLESVVDDWHKLLTHADLAGSLSESEFRDYRVEYLKAVPYRAWVAGFRKIHKEYSEQVEALSSEFVLSIQEIDILSERYRRAKDILEQSKGDRIADTSKGMAIKRKRHEVAKARFEKLHQKLIELRINRDKLNKQLLEALATRDRSRTEFSKIRR